MSKLPDTCKCGHDKKAHIYEEGKCRPGFPCEFDCQRYAQRTGKLPEREFKVGDKVWSIQSGPGVIAQYNKGVTHPLWVKSDDPRFNPRVYTASGKEANCSVHRSLFTLEEARDLFGVEPEKKKVKRTLWQALVKYPNGDYAILHTVYETLDAAQTYWNHHATVIKLVNPIEIEVDEVEVHRIKIG